MLIKTITVLIIIGSLLAAIGKGCSAAHERDRAKVEHDAKMATELIEWDRLQALKAEQAKMEQSAPAPTVEQVDNQPPSQVKPPTYSKSDLQQIEKANRTGRYEDFPDSIKYANNNQNKSCQKIVATVRQLENDPKFENTKQIRLQWQKKFDEASKMGCELWAISRCRSWTRLLKHNIQ